MTAEPRAPAPRYYWLSCREMTVYAATDDAGTVLRTAPITQRFVGQKLDRLAGWMSSLGGFEMAELTRPAHGAEEGGGE